MFISSNEKQLILLRIDTLESRVETLARSLNAVMDKLTTKVEDKDKLLKAQRANRNAYAKAYYYKKKAEKAAQPKE
jgi:hypothetical protein